MLCLSRTASSCVVSSLVTIRTGARSLTASAMIDVGSSFGGIRSLVAGDFNGDGRVDLAVSVPASGFGVTVATAGDADADADGLDEYAVLAPNFPAVDTGTAFVFEVQSEIGAPPMATSLLSFGGGAGERQGGAMVSVGTYTSTFSAGVAFGNPMATSGAVEVYVRTYGPMHTIIRPTTLTSSPSFRSMGRV